MKKTLSYFLYTMLIACIVCACSDRLDIVQDYGYRIETLPLPKKLVQGETVMLEFSIVREGYYRETAYKFRYFQSEGEGRLTDSYGTVIPVNRFRDIPSDDFVLYYRSECEEQQQLDFVFEDNFGRRVEYNVAFSNKKAEKEPEDTPEKPQPEPEDDEPEGEPDDGISPDEEPETVYDGNETDFFDTPKAAGILPKNAGKHTRDRKNHTGNENKKPVFETHNPIFDARLTSNETCFT